VHKPDHTPAHTEAAHKAVRPHHEETHPVAHHMPVAHEEPKHVEHTTVHHDRPHVVHHRPTHTYAAPPSFAQPAPHDAQTTPISDLHEAPPAPESADSGINTHAAGEYDIAELQAIERNLGWRGHLTTKGALSPLLTDGEYGPVTRDNWAQSANNRKLDPMFERTGPNTAQVNPDTYAQLKSVARQLKLDPQGSVVGGRRRLYIP
jgi:hypothetical protein